MDINEQTMKLLCAQKAQTLWASFTEQEKRAVRFGMFPASRMDAAKEEGLDGRLLAVALMECAQQDGGMIA